MDVQPKLGAWVRLLAARAVNKNDPDDVRDAVMACGSVGDIRAGRLAAPAAAGVPAYLAQSRCS
jgi:hypothetical protein